MQNPRLAERYAKSLIDLSTELKQLDTVYDDIALLQSICRESREFVLMLNSPIINADKKHKIINAITDRENFKYHPNFYTTALQQKQGI